MSRFIIDKEVFALLGNACFGAVIAKGIDNKRVHSEVAELLERETAAACQRLSGVNIREYPPIMYYREAFQRLGINPNRYANSVEALNKRIAGGAPLPPINTIVDIGNAMSVKYTLPMGAHDIDKLEGGDLEVRPATAGDSFIPFGETQEEEVPPGEIVYVSGGKVRTRRWIWRQSEIGKIDETSSNVVFPIDGFMDKNHKAVEAASEELASLLKAITGCTVQIAFLTAENNFTEL